MPCYDHRDHYTFSDHERDMKPIVDKLEKTEAMLCAIINVLVKSKAIVPILEAIDTEEAGVTPNDIAFWWKRHQIYDEARKAREKDNG